MIRQSIKDVYFSLSRIISIPSSLVGAIRWRFARPRHPEGHYLHLGCGPHYLPGFINVDGNVFRKIDLWHDLRNRLPFQDKSCHLVYMSHTLEHLFPHEAITLLGEIRRVLKDDGIARIAVPSFEHALMIASGDHADPWPRSFESTFGQAINYLFCDGQHKYAYSFEVLEDFARQAGFAVVVDYSRDHGVETKRYGQVVIGNEPAGSLVVELRTVAPVPARDDLPVASEEALESEVATA